MKWLKNLKVGVKIILGYMLVLLITVLVGFLGIRGISTMNQADVFMYEKITMPIENLLFLSNAFRDNLVNIRDIIYLKDPRDINEKAVLIDNTVKIVGKNIAEFEKTIVSDEIKQATDELKLARKNFINHFNNIIACAKVNKDREAMEIVYGEANNAGIKFKEAIDKLVALEIKNAKKTSEQNTALARTVNTINIAIIAAGIIISLGFGILITRSITGPVRKGLNFSQRLAQGDFTTRIELNQKDELGVLAKSLNDSADSLEQLVSEIIVASQNLSQAVEQISSGNENLSQRTSEQASSLEEIAATVEEAAASVNQNAENASHARDITNSGANGLAESGKISKEAVDSIIEMNVSSKKIEDIIAVINEIAFQTNLLALNAAVEAARAGEQGRGFAVVAGEVRNLAQRSGSSAKEIGSLIKETIGKVEKSTTLVNKTGEALIEIEKAAKNTAEIVNEIASASIEQKNGINQINSAITEMDSMTQQNASLVEETAAASEEMANQARELLDMVNRFKIREDIKGDVHNRKHRKMRINAASESKNAVSKDQSDKDGNGNGRDKTAAASHAMSKQADEDKKMQQIMEEEGFEQF